MPSGGPYAGSAAPRGSSLRQGVSFDPLQPFGGGRGNWGIGFDGVFFCVVSDETTFIGISVEFFGIETGKMFQKTLLQTGEHNHCLKSMMLQFSQNNKRIPL